MTSGFVVATDPVFRPPGWSARYTRSGTSMASIWVISAVIERAIVLAKERLAPSALLTFEPHPADHFAETSRRLPFDSSGAEGLALRTAGAVGNRFPDFRRPTGRG